MTRGNRSLPLGSPKQRALLALLLLHANELVSRERLIEELWGDAAPATVNAALNGYLSKLRRTLADGTAHEILATRAPGYVLNVAAEQVDARRFEGLLADGRKALGAGDTERAAAMLRDALSLWRGAALADLAYERFAQNEMAASRSCAWRRWRIGSRPTSSSAATARSSPSSSRSSRRIHTASGCAPS